MKIAHFYHVYADGEWLIPATEHFQSLDRYGLSSNITTYIGFVGDPTHCHEASKHLRKVVSFHQLKQSASGWEQGTMQWIPTIAPNYDVVFYAHTKGSAVRGNEQDTWRRTMTYFNVKFWRMCLVALQQRDVAGIWWIPKAVHPAPHFQGNFWWARSDYIAKLPAIEWENRWQAELWLGQAEPTVYDMYPGSAGGNEHVTDWATCDFVPAPLGLSTLQPVDS